ncbi:MAG: (2Fe-2S)-binding protein [Planctomycetota bacterium]|jgi:xanthine dehydrogenase YagT iron-sulfur-binding subunit
MPHDQSRGAPPPGDAREPAASPNGVSRRSFIQTLGASAAVGAMREAAADATAAGRAQEQVPIVGPGPVEVTLSINGAKHTATIDPATTLLDALRERLSLTGSKEICDRGSCGGCSVLVDGALTASCMMLATDAAGSEISTIEGLGDGDTLDPLQESFIRHDALQCGYCTPGLLMAAKALLNETPRPSLEQIKHGLSGNLCRCGTYTNVFNAVLEASGQAPIRMGEADR